MTLHKHKRPGGKNPKAPASPANRGPAKPTKKQLEKAKR